MLARAIPRHRHPSWRRRWLSRAAAAALLGALVPAGAVTVAAVTAAPAAALTLPVVSSGGDHSCALMADQSVWCWGHNTTGQLGVTGINESPVPVQVPGIPAAIGIGVGFNHSCAIDTGNAIWCWGSDAFGELGNGTTKYRSAPVQVSNIKGLQVSAGEGLTCAVNLNHKVDCWGDNDFGELGDGTTSNASVPKLVPGLSGVQQVAAGYFHACALLTGGAVDCWGDGDFGDLGNGGTSESNVPVPVIERGATSIAAGFDDTCAILGGQDLECWGDNSDGELGNGTFTDALVPTQVASLTSGVSQVTMGLESTCAVAATPLATGLCWGDAGGHGDLGNGDFNAQNPFPSTVFGLSAPPSGGPGGPVELSAGDQHTCVVLQSAKVDCWGYGFFGQTGTGTDLDHAIPAPVTGLPGAPGSVGAVTSGGWTSCAVTDTEGADCWGQDPGNGSLGVPVTAATPVTGLPAGGVGQISADYGGCVVMLTGAPLCWGDNTWGEIGNGTVTDQGVPVPVSGLSTVQMITTGGRHSCALVHNGGARCWGDNQNGDLGDGTTTQRDTPVPVTGLPANLAQISAGGGHTCALLKTQAVKCWGFGGTGDLGNGSTSDKSTPVAVKGLSAVVQIALGESFSCALSAAGGVSCWGYNADGELGNGSTANSDVPVGVSGLSSGVLAIAAGDGSACAVLQSGPVKCWGSGTAGELGNGTFTSSTVPVSASGYISDGASVAIDATGLTACSLNTNEQAECWGENVFGQVGNGTTADTNTPGLVSGL